MRVLILGLPGTGTSAVAEAYSRAGFSNCPPTFARGNHGYETHESLLGRAVNRIALGSEEYWPHERWNPDWEPRRLDNDPELHALARWFVETMDSRHDRWFFKNPESLQALNAWKRFEWDDVVGVYRHPEESIRNLHSSQKACYRREVWNRYALSVCSHSSRLIRFPDDIPALSRRLDIESPLIEGRPRESVSYDPLSQLWCAQTWKSLEDKRCKSMSATAT